MAQSNRGKTVAQLSALIQSGTLHPVALTEETFAAIRASEDQSIFISLLEERALLEASASSKRIREGRSLGLLDGIPVAWKDLFDIEGMATTAGSAVLKTAVPAIRDADVVAALAGAGMVSIGRVNMSEFAFSGLGINPHYGTPQNPASTDGARLPGGSSSGSGVAVASGLVSVSIGTDTGGSVRIPAAFNGIVGYKATRGRYSMRGVFPLSKSLDSLGPLCRTVQDAVWIDAAMRGFSAPDIRRGSVEGLSLVIPETIVFDDAEQGVICAFEAKIRRHVFPLYAAIFELMEKFGPLVTAEAFVLHRERLSEPEAEGMDPRVVARTRLGEKITTTGYIETLAARERLMAEFASSIGTGELVVSPTLPHVAPLTAPLLSDDELFVKTNAKTLRNTLIGNFLDGCGVSIPCGIGEANMPVGLLMSGLPNGDDDLLSVALAADEIIR
jgi:aspartyl-tRNA(Asn)/glutamyl-tRNA(Gln) amidotransferase subunit A